MFKPHDLGASTWCGLRHSSGAISSKVCQNCPEELQISFNTVLRWAKSERISAQDKQEICSALGQFFYFIIPVLSVKLPAKQ